jgi:hypothetical protein
MARSRYPATGAAAALTLLLALLCLTLSRPPGAGAEPAFACGHVHEGKAKRNPNPKGKPPLAIGDSTMLLPIPNLTRVGYNVNARGCRGFRQGISVMKEKKKEGKLPHLVLDAAYSNAGVAMYQIERALKLLGPSRVLVLVTEYDAETGSPPAQDTDVLFQAAERYPTRVEVLDWVSYSLPHHSTDEWFLFDLFHPNFEGAEAYAKFLKRALQLARNGRFPS